MGPPESLPGAMPQEQQQEQQEEQHKQDAAQEKDAAAESCTKTDADGHTPVCVAAAEQPRTQEAGGQACPVAVSGDEVPTTSAEQALTTEVRYLHVYVRLS